MFHSCEEVAFKLRIVSARKGASSDTPSLGHFVASYQLYCVLGELSHINYIILLSFVVRVSTLKTLDCKINKFIYLHGRMSYMLKFAPFRTFLFSDG